MGSDKFEDHSFVYNLLFRGRDMKILQASVHQGDPSFVGRGRQCVTNSIMAIMKSNTHNVDQWTKCDMDDVLKDGDRIYQLIKTKNKLSSEYLLLNELPDVLEGIIVQKSEPKAGLVSRNHTEAPFYHLEGAISSLLSEMPDTDGMLLTVGNTIPSYTGAVIIEKQSKVFYYFDPHSRGDTGMSNSDGKATISSHSNVPYLCLFIKHLTSSLFKAVSDVTFEIAAVKTEKISDYEDDLNYNSSFNESDCESCDLNVVNEKNKRNDLKTKDVQEIPFNNIQPSDSDSSSSFSGFEPVPENELDDKLSKLQMFTDSDEVSSVIDHIETDSNKVNPGTDKTDSHTDENESNAMELIAETVGDINDSFTLLKTIDTEIIENYDGASEDMHSDDSFKDPSYKSPQHETEESTDEDFPLSFFNKRKNFHKSKYGNQGAGDHIIQNAPQESNENIAESATNTEPQSNVNSQPDKEVEGVDENQVHLAENNESLERNNITIEQNVDQSIKRGRKRSRNEDEWKKNITKRRRNQGKSYTAKSGKSVKARVMRKACGHKCKFSCNNKFSEEAREKVFHQYWAIGDISKQRQFLIKFAQRKLKSRGSSENNRKHSITYTLPNLQTGETHRVCKTFFLNTLDVSHQRVSTAHSKQEHLPGVVNNDRRGKMPGSRSNKISEEQLSLVREHIKSFQTIESHYCRKDSNRKYLDPDLSLKKMYELYCKWCATEGTKPVLLHKYREIFNTEFNLGFFQPKKDQCDFCTRYNNATDAERENLSKDYENHIKNKDLARENKTNDKERSKTEKDLAVACFDLQQVLLTPKGFESSLYYKRRLNTYNFSLYNYETADGFCYVWNESISGRGANEMASCVYDFIEKSSKNGKKRFILYSDNAASQNKNKFYITMLWYALNVFGLHSVEHKYLIAGHTQNENDSVHSTIENSTRKKEIYSTSQWAAVIRMARAGKGYIVKEMSVSDFVNFKQVAENLKNFELDEDKEKVYISDIKMMKITAEEPNKLAFKTEYDQETYKKMNLLCRVSLKSSEKQVNAKDIKLENINTNLIPINHQKYVDLFSLCASGIIPRPHHITYLLLPHE